MKNILAVLLTLVLFCVPYAFGLALINIFDIKNFGVGDTYFLGFGVMAILYGMFLIFIGIRKAID